MKKVMKVSAAYEILQIEQSASPAEINASYKRLLIKYHPDLNSHRSDWSHQMTIRLTEAYQAILAYQESLEASAESRENEESQPESTQDSGYSLGTQARIANIYDMILDLIHSYYVEGMDKIYLRQEGSMRQRYRALMRKLSHVIESLALCGEMPGSAIQHRQIRGIRDFAQAFYENLLIKPKEHQVYIGDEAKAQKLYRLGSTSLDRAIYRGLLKMERQQGLICPGARSAAEKNLMFLLSNFPKSCYVPETLIKLYLLKALSGLCDEIEKTAE